MIDDCGWAPARLRRAHALPSPSSVGDVPAGAGASLLGRRQHGPLLGSVHLHGALLWCGHAVCAMSVLGRIGQSGLVVPRCVYGAVPECVILIL